MKKEPDTSKIQFFKDRSRKAQRKIREKNNRSPRA